METITIKTITTNTEWDNVLKSDKDSLRIHSIYCEDIYSLESMIIHSEGADYPLWKINFKILFDIGKIFIQNNKIIFPNHLMFDEGFFDTYVMYNDKGECYRGFFISIESRKKIECQVKFINITIRNKHPSIFYPNEVRYSNHHMIDYYYIDYNGQPINMSIKNTILHMYIKGSILSGCKYIRKRLKENKNHIRLLVKYMKLMKLNCLRNKIMEYCDCYEYVYDLTNKQINLGKTYRGEIVVIHKNELRAHWGMVNKYERIT